MLASKKWKSFQLVLGEYSRSNFAGITNQTKIYWQVFDENTNLDIDTEVQIGVVSIRGMVAFQTFNLTPEITSKYLMYKSSLFASPVQPTR